MKDGLHTILDVKGRGHYLGNILQVHTRFPGLVGEGDMIFQLDGKTITHRRGPRTSTAPAGLATPIPTSRAVTCNTTRETTACTAGIWPTLCGSRNR